MREPGLRLEELTPEEKRRLLERLTRGTGTEERRYPLSFSQHRLWFLNHLSPGNPFYNVEASVPIRAGLDVDALRRAINRIVARHEALRTTFRTVDGEPVQVVAPSLTVEVPVVDLRNLPTSERQRRAQDLRTEIACRPYDLAEGPLLRAILIQLDYNEYLFLLGMHHIISDGWSMGIFGRELEALYSAFANGREMSLPDLPIQYGDFAAWQRKWFSGERLNSELAFWKRTLEGFSTLELPTDRPRLPVQTFRGAFVNILLSKDLTTDLNALARREGVTLFMLLFAVFSVVLHRWTSQDDIVVGTYIANRNRAEIEGLIGFFLNTLVLRADIGGNPAFREFLQRVKRVALDAYAHQDLPFEKLVEELHPVRDLSRNPLFQVTFQVPNIPTQKPVENISSSIDPRRGAAIFDLAFMLFETNEGMAGQFEYSTDLFDESTIRRMAAHYQNALHAVIAEPDMTVSQIPLLTDAERRVLLVDWNETARPRASCEGLIERFERQAELSANEQAFMCGARSLTYGELNARANRIARYLLSLGIEPPVITGFLFARSLDLPPALMGLLKAGWIYLPLDASYPQARLDSMLRASRAKVLLTGGKIERKPDMELRMIHLADHEDEIASQSPENVGVRSSPDDLAYVIFTSGSTGEPKGVAASYRQILNRFEWMWDAYPFRPGEVSCQKTALSFVDSIWELLGPLIAGYPTAIIEDHVVRDHRLLVRELAAKRVTRIWVVPSMLASLLESVPNLDERLRNLAFWVASGEELPVWLLNRFRTAMPHATLYNLYGTSEIWDATWYDTWSLKEAVRVPIGRPIPNVKVYVLDTRQQPQPIGVPGELFVSGDGLANGYLHDLERTKERFVELPFELGVVAYRTGDRARFLSDGNVEFLGRIDNQIKVRGFRVEPVEIESALSAHPGVARAAVVPSGPTASDVRLAAYYVPASVVPTSAQELRGFLQSRLPEFLLPGSFICVEHLPMTPSGKVDRRVLQAGAMGGPASSTAFVPPRDDVEERIAAIWSEVLRRDRVSIYDDFFELGGHSLLATQVMSRIERDLGVDVPLQTLFQAPTLAGLAAAVVTARATADRPTPPMITRVNRDEYRLHAKSRGGL